MLKLWYRINTIEMVYEHRGVCWSYWEFSLFILKRMEELRQDIRSPLINLFLFLYLALSARVCLVLLPSSVYNAYCAMYLNMRWPDVKNMNSFISYLSFENDVMLCSVGMKCAVYSRKCWMKFVICWMNRFMWYIELLVLCSLALSLSNIFFIT